VFFRERLCFLCHVWRAKVCALCALSALMANLAGVKCAP
jgi:hypothetical protein